MAVSRGSLSACGVLLVACGPSLPEDPTTTTTTMTGTTSTGGEAGTSSTPTTGETTGISPDLPSTQECGRVCDETWTHMGDLEILPDTAPEALRCLGAVTGDVSIRDFTGPLPAELQALRAVDGALFIEYNDGLVDLAGLECLQRVAGLAFDGNDMLVDISALAGLESSPKIIVQGNEALGDLSPLSGVADVEFLFLNFINSLAVLPTFPAGTKVDSLLLWSCPALTSLEPLAGLRVHAAELSSLPGITSIAPLANWWPPGDPPARLSVGGMPQLSSLAGLEGLRHAETLHLGVLPQVDSLAPLGNLETAVDFTLHKMPALTTLAGLTSLHEVDRLEIGGCVAGDGLPGLIDLTGLEALTGLRSLRLIGNSGLQSLAGLDALVDGPMNLTIVDAPQLPPAEVAAFVAAHAVSMVCEEPPQDCCGI